MMQQDFKQALADVSEWMNAYQQNVADYPVVTALKGGEILQQIPDFAPKNAEHFSEIFADFKKIIVPGITHWQHPQFMGYFPSNTSPPSVLAEMLVASLGVQCMSWLTSPAATELEIRMMEWLRDLWGLPEAFSGVIQDSASSSTLIALLVAREKATQFEVNQTGVAGYKLSAYCSSEAHTSIEKAIKIAGIGQQNLRKIPVDEHQSIRIDLLQQAIAEDIEQGFTPFFMVGALGTTGSTAVDDLAAMAKIAKAQQIWFHIDAAYAGSALMLPEVRQLAAGYTEADSMVVNPHKWLLCNFDCSAFFIRDKESLLKTFTLGLIPEYLKSPNSTGQTHFMNWGVGLGRRFRALKLWFVLRWYGTNGLRDLVTHHLDLSARLEQWLRQEPHFEVLAQRHFNLLCFRLKASDEINMELLRRINASGKVFMTHTKINHQLALRMVIGQTEVNERHVWEAWQLIKNLAKDLM
ncbi:pyridoxal phosphate-dependent decarboxylase family protein [Iodobacter fluviatilis]|uniref:Aromatic-L-amino-acid decarboxylase n=1 Tax=Iodobacter fluviatilis TaxID=537 RepID=A0A377Q6T7_9NEIS|nr:pyridoxal-dependent decarboxylase [Iodobacter fluviatilis]TCU89626.1 aromatic-L-amino-acid decarboxylase [Iodobacter fluviatilis]STQ90996.1 L-2,4-diaminobutyrate decarboxylase [Iodobacter fluviatilis]